MWRNAHRYETHWSIFNWIHLYRFIRRFAFICDSFLIRLLCILVSSWLHCLNNWRSELAHDLNCIQFGVIVVFVLISGVRDSFPRNRHSFLSFFFHFIAFILVYRSLHCCVFVVSVRRSAINRSYFSLQLLVVVFCSLPLFQFISMLLFFLLRICNIRNMNWAIIMSG